MTSIKCIFKRATSATVALIVILILLVIGWELGKVAVDVVTGSSYNQPYQDMTDVEKLRGDAEIE